MKYLYKYPQAALPLCDLIETNRRRTRNDMEYELLDTGVFNDDRYFDVFVEYVKADPEDILVRSRLIIVAGAAELHLLPTLCSAMTGRRGLPNPTGPRATKTSSRSRPRRAQAPVAATHRLLGEFILSCEGEVPLLFTENSTNYERLFPGQPMSPRTSRTVSTTSWFWAAREL